MKRKLVKITIVVAMLLGMWLLFARFYVEPRLNAGCYRLEEVAFNDAKRAQLVRWAIKITREPDFSLLRDIDRHLSLNKQRVALDALEFDIEIFGSGFDRFGIATVPKSRFWKEGDEPFEIEFVKFVSARDFIVVNVGDLARDLGQKDGQHMKVGTLKYSVKRIDDRVAVYCD